MLDGDDFNNDDYEDDIDGLKIVSNFDRKDPTAQIIIKIGYYIQSDEVTSQQYIDHIKSISFKSVLGDSKQPQIAALILQYSNLSHIKDDLIQAKKVLAPYTKPPEVIEALQVIDIAIGLLL
jgi:hypothetical protein